MDNWGKQDREVGEGLQGADRTRGGDSLGDRDRAPRGWTGLCAIPLAPAGTFGLAQRGRSAFRSGLGGG